MEYFEHHVSPLIRSLQTAAEHQQHKLQAAGKADGWFNFWVGDNQVSTKQLNKPINRRPFRAPRQMRTCSHRRSAIHVSAGTSIASWAGAYRHCT